MTPARRPHGTGSIYQRKDGKWVATIEAGWTPTGTRRRVTITGRTRAEAARKLRDRQRQIAAEGLPTAGIGRATVKTWADIWLALHAERVRPKAYQADSSQVRHWVIPTIGHRRLDELTPADVRAVTRAILTAGRAEATARRAQTVLTKMLRDAIVEGHRVPERVLMVEGVTAAPSDRDSIPMPDALAMLDTASRTPSGSRWAAAFLQGMRQGECLGLTWDAVNLTTGTIDVSWQLQPLPYADRATGKFRVPRGYEARQLVGAYHLVRPKTASGQRIIPLVPWMTAALEGWQKVAPRNPWGLVWPHVGARGVAPQSSSGDRAAWYALQDEVRVAHVEGDCGRRYLLHEARHTTATLLLEAGVDPETIKAILGHSSIVTSRGYQHVSQVLARQAMEKIAARFDLPAISTE